jgi:hypothetical protein
MGTTGNTYNILIERNDLRKLDVYRRIILKWILDT